MHKIVRSVALALAAQAMLLRALLPVGWMPSNDSHAPLIICPMMGGMMHAQPAHRGLPRHDSRMCPFTASLAQLATVSLPSIDSLAALTIAGGDFRPRPFVFAVAFYRAQSPRGPPRPA